MTTIPTTNKCPYCMEDVAPGAVVCKHCHSTITGVKKSKKSKKKPLWMNKFMLGVYTGIVFMFLMIYLWNKLF